jgi:UDP-N-acetylglucosamine transferase subunit ALG13
VAGALRNFPAGRVRGATPVIFVTVGSWPAGFDRLILATVSADRQGLFASEDVLVQARSVPCGIPMWWRIVPFLPTHEFTQYLVEATLLISHGGSTLVTAARAGKLPVAMPRRPELGEIVNGHQIRFVAALADRRLVAPAYEVEDLPEAIMRARTLSPGKVPDGGGLASVAQAVRLLAGERKRGR